MIFIPDGDSPKSTAALREALSEAWQEMKDQDAELDLLTLENKSLKSAINVFLNLIENFQENAEVRINFPGQVMYDVYVRAIIGHLKEAGYKDPMMEKVFKSWLEEATK